MIQVAHIREQREKVIAGLKKRGLKDVEELLDKVIKLDDDRKANQQQADDLKAKSNSDSKKVGELMKAGNKAEADAIKEGVSKDKEKIKALEQAQQENEASLKEYLYKIPNVPHEKVPAGKTPEE